MAEQSGAPQAEGPLGLDLSPVTPAEHLLSAALAPGGELYQPRPEGLFGHLLQTAIEPLQAAPAAAQGSIADRLAGLGNIVIPYVVGGAPRDALSAGVRLSTGDLGGYHGTPHTFAPEPGAPFGSFRDEAIGSGEGAQAYGWGHYVAGNPKVAEGYQKKLSADDSSGHLLEVHILPEESQLLDWNKPLSEQSPEVQQALRSVHDQYLSGSFDPVKQEQIWRNYQNDTGRDYYKQLANLRPVGGQANTSAVLHSAGIPGIKYLDAGSRNISVAPLEGPSGAESWQVFDNSRINQAGEGQLLSSHPTQAEAEAAADRLRTHNYVIFHPSNLRIVARNGTPLTPVDHDPFAEGTP